MSFDKAVENVGYSVVSIVKKKNKDYGNSYEKMIDKYGEVALLIRFQDKLGRLDSLVLKGQEQEVSDESIEDTLKDIAGYALLELTRRELEKEKKTTFGGSCISSGTIKIKEDIPVIKDIIPHWTFPSTPKSSGTQYNMPVAKHEDDYF
jgi:hypothetical protein